MINQLTFGRRRRMNNNYSELPRLSNCSSLPPQHEESQLSIIDLQLFLVEILLILAILLVTVAKRLCFKTNADSATEETPTATVSAE